MILILILNYLKYDFTHHCISPHHSHHLHCYHLSLPQPFTPDLKLISFTDTFLRSLFISYGLPVWILNPY